MVQRYRIPTVGNSVTFVKYLENIEQVICQLVYVIHDISQVYLQIKEVYGINESGSLTFPH